MKCSTRLVRLEDDLDEDEDNCISITEVDGDDRFGTASKIWEAGLILAKYIHRNEKSFKGKKVLELGSGTGVLGLYLAAIGFDVILSDLEPVCTTILKMNSEEPRNVAMMNESGGKVQIHVIDWAMPKEKLRECFEEFLVKENIGLIVSSDPIYNTINMLTFSTTIGSLREFWLEKDLKRPVLLLAHKARNDKIDANMVKVFEELGFWGKQIPEKDMDPRFINNRIDIISFDDNLD